MTHVQKNTFHALINFLSNAMKIRMSYKEDARLGHMQRERLPKSKMASSDDRFMLEIMHVLCFGNRLNKELCRRFIFTNLQQSLDH